MENRLKIVELINGVIGDFTEDESVLGSIDDLDLVEIVMDVEEYFDLTINSDSKTPASFNDFSELIDWLLSHIEKEI